MDQRRNRRGTFHGIGQPNIKRKLRRLAAGSNKQQQRGGREHRIADREGSTVRQFVDVDKTKRAQIPGERERAENESGIADTVHNKCLVSGGRGGVAMKVKTNQQIRTQANAFPSNKQKYVVIRKDESKHGSACPLRSRKAARWKRVGRAGTRRQR